MKYEKIEGYTEDNFRMITRVKIETFNKMVEIVKKSYDEKHKRE